MGTSYQTNAVTPKTVFRLEDEGSHFHPSSREQVVPTALLYQPYGRPLKQASEASKDLALADDNFDGFLGTTVVDEDVKRNFEGRTNIAALNAVFHEEVVSLFRGHGYLTVGNGTETVAAKLLVGSGITPGSLSKYDPIKFVAGEFEAAVSTNVAWGEFVEEPVAGEYRIKMYQNSVIVP